MVGILKRGSRIFIVLTIFLMLVFIAHGNSLLAASSVNVPLDHWSYSALDKLEGFGLIQSNIYSARPYTRLEVARLVNEALGTEDYKKKKLPPIINSLLEKFQREFKMELEEISPSGVATRTFLKPVAEAQAKYVYVEGQPRRFVGFPREPGFGIIASEGTPLLPNNEGIIYNEHNNFSLQFASSARFAEIFSAYVEPIFIARDNKGNVFPASTDDFEVDLLKGYAKVSTWNIELEAGRDSMWLGQGYHGTLLLSNNAPPLDMLKLSNPNPTILPWYFSYLGLVKYTFFASRLDGDRDFPHPWFMGFHMAMKPHPLFELGWTYTQMFGGEGAPSGPSFPGAFGTENGLMSFDARLRLPFLRNAQLYAEYGGEDSSSDQAYWYEPIFQDVSYLLGIYFPVVFCDGRMDLRIEYANNAFKRGPKHVGFWYGHGIYTSGYTYDKMILGHHMGPDSEDFFVRSTFYITDKLRAGLDYDYMGRGLTLGDVVERTHSVGTDLTYDFNEWLSLSGRLAFGKVTNFDMIRGEEQIDTVVMTGLKVHF